MPRNTIPKISQRTAVDYIARYQAFEASALSAQVYPNGCGSIGHGYLTQDSVPPDATYVVFSYFTPIAWVEGCGRAVRTAQRFSPTTSTKHQPCLYRLADRPDGDREEIERRNEADRIRRAAEAEAARVEHEEDKRIRAQMRKEERAKAKVERALQQ